MSRRRRRRKLITVGSVVSRVWRRRRGLLMINIALALAIFAADILGLRSLSASYSRDLFIRVAAPFYPATGQRHVAVVLIDDHAAERIAERYPIGLADHGRLLRRVLCEGPSVVVVAVAFRYLRDGVQGVDSLAEQLRFRRVGAECRQVSPAEARAGLVTKVLLAAPDTGTSQCVPFRENLPENCTEARKLSELAAVATPIDFASTTLDGTYRLGRESGTTVTPSPAVAAFLAHCERARNPAPGCRDAPRANLDQLVVQWGIYLSETHRRFGDTTGCLAADPPPADLIGRLLSALGILATRFGAGEAEQTSGLQSRPNCRYATELSATRLITAPAGDAFLNSALADRIVVYGAEITGIPDSEIVPVHGRVPGSHFNAMVLDNLATWGSDYVRRPREVAFAGLKIDPLQAIETVWILLLIGLRGFAIPILLRYQIARGSRVLFGLVGIQKFTYYACFVLGSGVLLATAVFLWNWPALNLVGLLGYHAIAPTLDETFELERDQAVAPQSLDADLDLSVAQEDA